MRDETRERIGERRNQRLPGLGRQIVARKQFVAHGGEMAVALGDPRERGTRQFGCRIFEHGETGRCGPDFRECRRHRTRNHLAGSDRNLKPLLPACSEIDEFEIEERRRAFDHDFRDVELILGKPDQHRAGCILAVRQRLGERAAHLRRRIVQEHGHCRFGCHAVAARKIGVEIGACQCAGGIGAFARRRSLDPLQKLANDHPGPASIKFPHEAYAARA